MTPSRLQRLIPFRDKPKHNAGSLSKPKEPLEAPAQGLKVVAEGEQPDIDIVAVHGLNGHRDKTWTAANDMHWLRDLLPTDIPNARVFCWGYDANTHGDRVSCQYLYDHARQLVSDLCLERRLTKTTQRPIIFVAHSLGGIIVKSALIHSDAARKGALEEHRSIKTSTYGIMFMGTPHQGGSGVQLGKLLVNVASVFVAADDRLMKHLEQNSEWLQQQLEQYNPISSSFITKFAYEEYKTPTVLGHSIIVVPKASAVVPGAADAEPIVIHADHINMAKFASKEDSGYRTVSGHLRIMAESAGEAVALRWAEEGRVDAARTNSKESFDVVFSLPEASETNHFVTRQAELTAIHKTLSEGTGRQAVTLHGLGGIGKTQLAIAYAKAHCEDYSAIFWVNIKDEVSVKQSYSHLARRILQEHSSLNQLSGISGDSKADEVVAAVKRWLEHAKNTRWLMVFDNYDTPKVPGNADHGVVDIRQFLPEAYHGSVIVTTRSSKVNIGRRIKVGKLEDIRDSLQILSNASHREGVINDPDAAELAKELDGLPLALATAGAYLDQVATSFAEYLRLYRASWLRLQHTSPEVSTYEDRQLYSTWQLSLDHIKQQSELSVKLLQLWAYFDNQDLWFELLREGRTGGSEWLCQVTEDKLSFNQVVRVLCDHGLIDVDKSSEGGGVESKGYGMHSCVHSWTVHVLNQEWDSSMAGVALECVGRHVPDNNAQNSWVTQQRLLRHLARCWSYFIDGRLDDNGKDWILYNFGYVYSNQGKFEEAEKMYLRALAGYEKAWGREHTSTLNTVNNLGSLYKSLGRLDEAEKMYLRALAGKEKAWGREHTSTLNTVNNLGSLYADLGRLDEAEKMHLRALAGKEKAWGQEHTSTLDTINNLGTLYQSLGRLDEAEKMYLRALAGYKKAWGQEHTSTLGTVNNLGNLYKSLGRLDEAEKMYLQVLAGYEKAWGREHTSTLDTVNNLGSLYADLGRLNEAEKMYLRALTGYEKAWGQEHTSTLGTVNNLGLLYADLGRLNEAEKMYLRALAGYKKAWGQEHTSTLDTVNNLGSLYADLGRLNEAEKMYLRALTGYEKTWGQEHTSTLDTVNNLGSLYADLGRLNEAEKMYLRALAGYKKAWGQEHTSTLDTVNNLGSLYADLGQLDKAEKMYQQALAGYKKALGKETVKKYIPALSTAQNLANLFWQTGRAKEAEELYGQTLFGVEAVFGRLSDRYRDIVKALDKIGSNYKKDTNC